MSTLTKSAAAQAERYLTFHLAEGSYGLPVAAVREIIRMRPITAVPQMPPDVRGVVNLRDRIIPVVDLRQRLGLGAVEPGPRTCIVIVERLSTTGRSRPTGLLVDDVEDVLEIPLDAVSDAPEFGGATASGVRGHARVRDGVKTLVDLDRVLGVPSGFSAAA